MGKKRKRSPLKRADVGCESAGMLRDTGPGAFRLNRAERMRSVIDDVLCRKDDKGRYGNVRLYTGWYRAFAPLTSVEVRGFLI